MSRKFSMKNVPCCVSPVLVQEPAWHHWCDSWVGQVAHGVNLGRLVKAQGQPWVRGFEKDGCLREDCLRLKSEDATHRLRGVAGHQLSPAQRLHMSQPSPVCIS